MLEFKRDGSKAAICLAPALLLMSVFTLADNQLLYNGILNNYYFAINNADFYNEMMSVPKSYGYFMGGRFTGIGIENFWHFSR